MNPDSTFSFSLQKQIQNENIAIETENNCALKEFNIKSIPGRIGIMKKRENATIIVSINIGLEKDIHIKIYQVETLYR